MTLTRRRLLSCAAALPWLTTAHAAERPRVVASFSILGDLVREVAGDAVALETLVGPEGDAHGFEPRPADARRIAQADLIVVNGLHFEPWMDRLLRAGKPAGRVVVASEGVVPLTLEGDTDPHAWQSLANGRRYVENLRVALGGLRPGLAETVNSRAQAYDARLAALDRSVRDQLAAIAPERRRVVTSHDAFGYFAKAYGVEFLAAQGWSTEREATAAQVARLVRQLKAQQVHAVFLENMSNPRLIRRLAQEAGATIGGELYSDALSKPGGEADSYEKMFEHNARTLVAALVGG